MHGKPEFFLKSTRSSFAVECSCMSSFDVDPNCDILVADVYRPLSFATMLDIWQESYYPFFLPEIINFHVDPKYSFYTWTHLDCEYFCMIC